MFKQFKHILVIFLILVSSSVVLAQKPVADFVVDIRDGCGNIVVTVTNISTNNPTKNVWDMGDGNTIEVESLEPFPYGYAKVGTYTISLTSSNASGSDTKVKNGIIRVHPNPTCDFLYSPSNGCKPLAVNFTNKSTSQDTAVTIWSWDFGDGTTSTLESPSHVYQNAGDFKVSLSIVDGFTCTNQNIGNKLHVSEKPKAAFTSTTPEACAPPFKVDFTNNSTGSSLTYAWDFGNNQKSTDINPSNNYSSSGSFNVSLIVTDANGCADTATQKGFVQVNTFAADFSIDKVEGCIPTDVTFTDLSPSSTSWNWSFSDGGTSTVKNPVHTFKNAGTCSATLSVTNTIGCVAIITKTGVFKANGQPVINFDATSKVGCKTPFITKFTDNTPDAVAWKWKTGDGGTSTQQSFDYTYNATNNYPVELIVTDSHGCIDTLEKNKFIRIAGAFAYFKSFKRGGCAPLTLQLLDSSYSTTNITDYLWEVESLLASTQQNPFFTFTDTGKYDVKLTVTDELGCTDVNFISQYIQVGIKPTVDFTADPVIGCYPLSVNFTAKTLTDTIANRYLWDYGDGMKESAFDPTHLYADTGYFTVKLNAFNNGCMSDTVIKDSLIFVQPPQAIFNSSIVGCDTSFKPLFINSSKSDTIKGINWFIWSFGDGSPDTITRKLSATFTHEYKNSGLFFTKLVAIDSLTLCKDSSMGRVHISKRDLDFMQDTTLRDCLYDNIKYKDLSKANNPIIFRNWDFGDNTSDTSKTDSILHKYSIADVYNITLIITDSLQCKETIIKSNDIEIHNLPSPTFIVKYATLCVPSTITFENKSKAVAPTNLMSWVWDFGDGTKTDTDWEPSHIYNSAPNIERTISLHVIDSLFCDSIKYFKITPTFPIVAFKLNTSRPNSGDSLICYSDTAQFSNQTTGIGLHYTWDFGDGSPTVNTFNAKHFFKTDSTQKFIVSLTVSDTNSCDTTITKRIHVSHPNVFFGADKTKVDCPVPVPNIVFLDSSKDVSSWAWNLGETGANSTLKKPEHKYYNPGVYDVKLIGQNIFGCSDTLLKPGFIQIEGPSASFSYTPLSGCAPLQVDFLAANAKRVGQYKWLYQDGSASDSTLTGSSIHFYKIGGNPTPMLELTDSAHKTCKVLIPGTNPIHVIFGEPKFQLNSEDSTCTYGNIEFFDLSKNPISSRTWYFGDGDSVVTTSRSQTHFYDSVGTYPVTLKIVTEGCEYAKTKPSLLYIFNPPNVDFIWEDSIGCTPLSVKFNVIESSLKYPVDSLRWDFGNSLRDTAHSPTTQYTSSGPQTVKLDVIYKNKCKQQYSKIANMTVYPMPVADFIINTDSVFANEIIPFVDQSKSNILKWYWSFGDSVKSTMQHPFHIYTQTGTYDVNLLVKSIGDCSDSITKTITITEGIIISNFFTPNGDGVNDEFRVPISGYTNYHLTIFNRWGEILFDSNVKNSAWDGRTPTGKAVPSGTYYFILQYEDSKGQVTERKDFLTLLRD